MFDFRRGQIKRQQEQERALVAQRDSQALVDIIKALEAEAAAKLAKRFSPAEIAIIHRLDAAKAAADAAVPKRGKFDTPSELALKEVAYYEAIDELVSAQTAMDAMMQRKRASESALSLEAGKE